MWLGLQAPKKRSFDDEANSIWEAQCTLTLWLSQLILIPFDLATIDSSIEAGSMRYG